MHPGSSGYLSAYSRPMRGRSIFTKPAWRGYILWNLATLGMFRMLRSQYDGAVDRIQPTAVHDHSHDDRDRQLGRHLMTMYWHGEFGLDSEDKLLSRFFSSACIATGRRGAVPRHGVRARKLRLRGGTGASDGSGRAAGMQPSGQAISTNWRPLAGGSCRASSMRPGRSRSSSTY